MKHKNTSTQSNELLSYFNNKNKTCFAYKEAIKIFQRNPMKSYPILTVGIEFVLNIKRPLKSCLYPKRTQLEDYLVI